VTLIAYPALAATPEDRWPETHAAHGRRITPLVVLVYGLLAGACGWALLSGPRGWTVGAVLAAAVAGLLTAFGAAPLHGRLGTGRSPLLLHRLLVVDRLRTVAAAVAALAAILA
jgi:hypothetical protein